MRVKKHERPGSDELTSYAKLTIVTVGLPDEQPGPSALLQLRLEKEEKKKKEEESFPEKVPSPLPEGCAEVCPARRNGGSNAYG